MKDTAQPQQGFTRQPFSALQILTSSKAFHKVRIIRAKGYSCQETEYFSCACAIAIPSVVQYFSLQEMLAFGCALRKRTLDRRPGALTQHMFEQMAQALSL